MSEDNLVKSEPVKAEKQETESKVEKSIDTKANKDTFKASQATVSVPKQKKVDTFTVYNPTGDVVELDLGRDKSVRLDPYARVELDESLRSHKAFKALEGKLKFLQ